MTTRVIRTIALRRLKDTYRSRSGLLLPHIERHVMRTMTGGRPSDHSEQYMHPSDMVKPEWCGRHDYYRITGAPAQQEQRQANPSFRMTNVFAEGHAIHGKWQTWLWEMGVLVGDWSPARSAAIVGSPSHRPSASSVSASAWSTRSIRFRHERYMVEGHADGAVHLPDFRSLIEIKSIGIRTLAFEAPRLYQRYLDGESAEDRSGSSITHPFSSHMRQGQLYLWMSWPIYEQIIFIYESKFHQQTKEFVVEYNKDFIARHPGDGEGSVTMCEDRLRPRPSRLGDRTGRQGLCLVSIPNYVLEYR